MLAVIHGLSNNKLYDCLTRRKCTKDDDSSQIKQVEDVRECTCNGPTCAVSLPQHAFLVGLCLQTQTALNCLSKCDMYMYWKEPVTSHLTQTSARITLNTVLIIHRQRSLMVIIYRTREDSCNNARVLLPLIHSDRCTDRCTAVNPVMRSRYLLNLQPDRRHVASRIAR